MYRFLPVVFLTAMRDDDHYFRSFQSGGDSFMTKPFDPVELRNKVAYLLDARRLGDGR